MTEIYLLSTYYVPSIALGAGTMNKVRRAVSSQSAHYSIPQLTVIVKMAASEKYRASVTGEIRKHCPEEEMFEQRVRMSRE